MFHIVLPSLKEGLTAKIQLEVGGGGGGLKCRRRSLRWELRWGSAGIFPKKIDFFFLKAVPGKPE